VPAEPTPQEIEAFRNAWLQADAVGLYGERTRYGLRAVFALHDPETAEPEYGRELGFRLPDGREFWSEEHSDGSWTPGLPDVGVRAIDTDERTTIEQIAAHLPVGSVVLVRPLRTYLLPIEETPVRGLTLPDDEPPGAAGIPG
jgi:hypothetical protein